MVASVETFLIRFPEFQEVNAAKIKIALDDAALQISAKAWGNLYEQGVCALASHLLYLNGGFEADGQGGGEPARSITSESGGGLSFSYGAGNTGLTSEFGTYESTAYGQRYLELKRLINRHILVTK